MTGLVPGEVIPGDGEIPINVGRPVLAMTVSNTGDRPVQVGSHYHFAESNAALEFDRAAAWGHRLAVPAGTSVRFEPGMPRDVELVPLAGRRIVPGLRGLTGGPLDAQPIRRGQPHQGPRASALPDPSDIEPAGSLDEDTGEEQPSNGSPR